MTANMSEETSGMPEVELTAGIVEYEDTGGQGQLWCSCTA
jgi:hypothetical protein